MSSYRSGIVSVSLGRAWEHDFDNKIKHAANCGFEGIEVFYEDIEYLAKHITGSDDPPGSKQLLLACQHIRELFDSLRLAVICLQPFLFYEGLLDREEHSRMIEKIKIWFNMVKVLGTDTIQIPANFLPTEKLTGDMNVIVSDLRKLADLGLQEEPPVRFAYESLCWSTHIDTWEKSWAVVQQVDRANFGLCLDTFNIAGRIWADPESPTGKTPNADADLDASIKHMLEEVDVNKVFFIQVVDAERLASPLVEGHPFHNKDQPARMSWSRNARTFLYETDRGAYLPVEKIAKAIIQGLGYKGFVSMELFSRTMSEKGDKVPEEHARRGMEAWEKFRERLQLD